MHSDTLTVATTMVAIMAQTGEAIIGRGAGLLGTVGAGIGATATTSPNVSRSVAAPNRASDVEYDRCFSALTTTAVQVTSPAADVIQFDNVPAYCMNFADVLIGDGTGPQALPCGSACLQCSGVTPGQYSQLA